MTDRRSISFPPAQQAAMRRAWWLEVTWMFVICTYVAALWYAMGQSQAMKTALFEDFLSFVPPIAFLVASHVEPWKPNPRFPLGYARVTSIAYLVSAVTLAGFGLFLIVDSGMALIEGEHPTVGSTEMFGVVFWSGWLMIAALVYSIVPPVIFGRLKMKPARELHDKVLWADALMNKADWTTGVAAVVGILGIGFGLWWADSAAAIVIAIDVLHDGARHTMAAVRDLMDETPRGIDDKHFDPLAAQLAAQVDAVAWVRVSKPQLREEGRWLTGAIYVEVESGAVEPEKLAQVERELRQKHWRVYDVGVVPVVSLDGVQAGRLG